MTNIISSDDFITPILVQSAIRERYIFTKNVEVEVRKKNNEFDIYKNNQYQFSLNESGEEI